MIQQMESLLDYIKEAYGVACMLQRETEFKWDSTNSTTPKDGKDGVPDLPAASEDPANKRRGRMAKV
eukprot:9485405-Pyramimonas_sp.AAC.2